MNAQELTADIYNQPIQRGTALYICETQKKKKTIRPFDVYIHHSLTHRDLNYS